MQCVTKFVLTNLNLSLRFHSNTYLIITYYFILQIYKLFPTPPSNLKEMLQNHNNTMNVLITDIHSIQSIKKTIMFYIHQSPLQGVGGE